MPSTILSASPADQKTEAKEANHRSRYHNVATIVNLYPLPYKYIWFRPDIYSHPHSPFSVKESQILYELQ